MGILDEIRDAQRKAVERVIAGGMKESLRMAQVLAAEDVVVADLERMKPLLEKDWGSSLEQLRDDGTPESGVTGTR